MLEMSVQLLLLHWRLSSLSIWYTVIILIIPFTMSPLFSGFHIFLFVDLLLHFSWTYPPVNPYRGKGPMRGQFLRPGEFENIFILITWVGNFSFNFKAMALFSLHFSFVLQVSNVILISDLLFMTCFTLRKTLGFFFLYSYSESLWWYPIIWAFITLGDFHGKKFKFQYFKIFSLGSFSFLYTLLQKC